MEGTTVRSMYWFWFFSSSGNMSCCNWRSRNKVPANESVLSKELVLVGGKQRTRQQTAVSLLHRKRLEAQRSSGRGNRRGGGLFSLPHDCCQDAFTHAHTDRQAHAVLLTFHSRHFYVMWNKQGCWLTRMTIKWSHRQCN